MKFLAIVSILCGLAMTAPLAEPLVNRAVASAKSSSTLKISINSASTAARGATLGVNVDGSSSPLLGVGAGSATIIAVKVGSSVKATSLSIKGSTVASIVISAKSTSTAASSTPALVTSISVAPTSTLANPTGLPSTISAPVQGQGALSLNNLPAMPAVIDKTISSVLGSVYGLMSGFCNQEYKCTVTVAGTVQSLLVDGDDYTGSSSFSAWCDGGHCYGSANPTVNATAPFTVTCDNNSACSATLSGAANAIFTNGQQVELWGWLTPAGYCSKGVCTASMQAFGDPMY